MKPVVVSRQVNAPIETVFAAFTDFASAPERIAAIERVRVLTDGPVRVGTRFEETRKMFGKEATETMWVTELDAPRSVVLGAESHGCRYRTEFRFAPKDGGTEVTMDFRGEPLTVTAKIFGVLIGWMAGGIAKMCAKDLEDLAAWCEGKGRATGGAGL